MLRRDFIALLGSAAITRPFSVLAAQGKVAKIGVLLLGYPDPSLFIKGLREGLRDLGYEEGRSIELIIRSADGKPEALASLAADLIRSKLISLSLIRQRPDLRSKKQQRSYP
jgi:putative tryptophan/tyrosine transport system substrate-binding protein